ncbi:MAG: dCMP deaminase family protein [Thermoplasmata archaeon]|nr:MAG: dCMP deaminase family protein [Thermoplasmata archaeon]KAA0010193.1 MAG: dCMP deaminase family protein [Thermoplasmata archaeon]RLF50245.1 MAG: cytidine deaminase [Thermoplasmata archaeon]
MSDSEFPKRISKDLYYLNIAKAVAKRSPCIRRRFGAIIVKDDTIVSTGYNGPARGSVNCDEVGCLKDVMNLPPYTGYDYCPAVHAEENALLNAARHGSSVIGGTLYLYGESPDGSITEEGKPCDRCKRALINSGIKEVVTIKPNNEVVRYSVSDWVREDRENYLRKLREERARNKDK